ncbi:selenoprotein W-related protein [Entomortierella parvispora]|uniref:Selenoprotein W-related protein n=1 Tax=Entomortierella parvispora TaxID=205924 RepID=A0A9P3LTE0_9FUNG|nr:selenoprotein W-related protein [Entomortierella parvispora]
MTIETRHPRIEIEFCTGCKWHLRAGWMAQELLLTFGNTIGELALIPGKSATFIVRVNGDVVFDRKDHGRFPEMKEVKQLVRTVIAPEMGLGHSDTAVKSASTSGAGSVTEPTETAPKPAQVPDVAVNTENVDDDDDDSTKHDTECKTCL